MLSKSLDASSACNEEQYSTDTASSHLIRNPLLPWRLNAWENNLSLSEWIPFIRPLIEVKNHLAIITDIAVESFIYTFSDKGKLFALSSPSPLSKAVECLEVSTPEVVYKSHQAKPVITESISSLGLFLFHICKMFHFDTSCDKALDFSWTPYMSNGTRMHGFICTSLQSCFPKPCVHVEGERSVLDLWVLVVLLCKCARALKWEFSIAGNLKISSLATSNQLPAWLLIQRARLPIARTMMNW